MEDLGSLQLNTGAARNEGNFYLVVETQGELYALRWALVRQAGILLQTEIDFSTTPPRVQRNDEWFPVCHLWELVGQRPPAERPAEIPAVLLVEENRRMALVPERILWKQDAIFQELPGWLKKSPAVSGAIALGSGVAVIVLEPLGNGSTLEDTVSEKPA